MSGWPVLDDLKKLLDVNLEDDGFDVTIQGQLDTAIGLVKAQVGSWDELTDEPDAALSGAALRAGYLLALREAPPAIVRDEVFMTYLHGKRRRFAIA